MSFTTLRVIDKGVLLYKQHEERFRNDGEQALQAYRKFAASAAPGIYNLWYHNQALIIKKREKSRLFDNMPVRYCVSPIANLNRRIEKPAMPEVYGSVIKPGVATLLTSADGTEIFESCSAAVITWSGKNIIMAANNKPAVKSTMEELIKGHGYIIYEPILVNSDYPILLLNAIKCTCTVSIPGRYPFPQGQIEKIQHLYFSSVRR